MICAILHFIVSLLFRGEKTMKRYLAAFCPEITKRRQKYNTSNVLPESNERATHCKMTQISLQRVASRLDGMILNTVLYLMNMLYHIDDHRFRICRWRATR